VLALWLVMMSVAVLAPVPLPVRGGSVSLTAILDLAAILVFGPPVACWLGVLSRVAANARGTWRSILVLRVGQSTLAIATAGMVYTGVGGRVGSELHVGVAQLRPLVLAGITYLVTTQAVLSVADLLRSPEFALRRLVEHRESTLWHLMLLPFAVSLAVTQAEVGIAGVVLFAIPLLLAIHAARLWGNATRGHIEGVRTLMSAVDAADPFTRGHAYRISKMCVRLARRMGLTKKDIEELEYAALLHDIGRMAIQRDILLKPGALSSHEQSVLRTHPKIGADVLRRIGFFPDAALLVESHHEQPDAMGYPEGLAAEAIPVGSRIIMAVAAFDAMTSDRPYRRGLSPEAAFDELLQHAGTQFFTDVVEALIELYSHGSLFDDFAPDVLEHYARGDGNSRGVEEHLKRQGVHAPVTSHDDASPEDDDVPTLDLPEAPEACTDTSPASDIFERDFDLTPDGAWKLTTAALSDVGCVRDNNEDAYGVFHGDKGDLGCLLVVADGMGGAAAGEVASELAVETIRGTYFGGDLAGGAGPVLAESIQLANEIIHARASNDPQLEGMGTTCTAAAIVGSELRIGHVGDSRAYLLRDSGLECLTRDHTLAEALKGVPGATGPAGAEHILTQCLGSRTQVDVDLAEPIALRASNVLLLCSDGLTNMVRDDEIGHIVSTQSPATACRKLVELARERGGPDNITLTVARVEPA
jgi:putative nucleotidyltransferase with HDIG domain